MEDDAYDAGDGVDPDMISCEVGLSSFCTCSAREHKHDLGCGRCCKQRASSTRCQMEAGVSWTVPTQLGSSIQFRVLSPSRNSFKMSICIHIHTWLI